MKLNFAKAAAVALFTTLPAAGNAFDIGSMTDAERQAFRDEVRAYLLDNPEVLIEAINVLEARKAEAQASGDAAMISSYADQLFNDGYSYVGGNLNGDLTIVEFIDYRCGYCRRAHPEVAELIRSDGNIRYIIKEFPILGADSEFASRFAIAVKQTMDDEAYYTAHDALMTHNGAMNAAAVRRIASKIGGDADALLAAMDSAEVTQILQMNRALGQAMQISGTPSFVVGDEMLRGYLPLASMQELVASKRTR